MAESGQGHGASQASPYERGFRLTRRRLLAGASGISVLLLAPMACAPVASQSWADATYWDDGTGWID